MNISVRSCVFYFYFLFFFYSKRINCIVTNAHTRRFMIGWELKSNQCSSHMIGNGKFGKCCGVDWKRFLAPPPPPPRPLAQQYTLVSRKTTSNCVLFIFQEANGIMS